MGKVRRKFTDDFKLAVVRQVQAGSITASAAARKHQISPNLIYMWMKKFDGGNTETNQARPSPRERELERENAQLKEKVAELFLAVDFLKKTELAISQKRVGSSSVITKSNWARFKKGAK